MNMLDIIALAVVIIVALGGYAMGFAKSLKAVTGGIMGVIISVFVCVAFGGALQNLPVIKNFIDFVNTKAAEAWAFLGVLKIGYAAFYALLFLATQILRLIVVNTKAKIDYSRNKAVIIINKALGGVLCTAFLCGVVLLAFAVLGMAVQAGFGEEIVDKLKGSYLYVIYQNNPINFTT